MISVLSYLPNAFMMPITTLTNHYFKEFGAESEYPHNSIYNAVASSLMNL
jgi:hypothetical protein